jgi:hypothetical protein
MAHAIDHIYLYKKVVCLFCFVCNVEISQSFGKPLMNRGVVSWFHYVSTYGGRVIEY